MERQTKLTEMFNKALQGNLEQKEFQDYQVNQEIKDLEDRK